MGWAQRRMASLWSAPPHLPSTSQPQVSQGGQEGRPKPWVANPARRVLLPPDEDLIRQVLAEGAGSMAPAQDAHVGSDLLTGL